MAAPKAKLPCPLWRLRRSHRFRIAGDRGLGGGEAGDRHTIRGAGNVVHADAIAEHYRARLAAVLAADADFEVGTRRPAFLDGPLDQHAYTLLVQYAEGVGFEDLLLLVVFGEFRVVVAG